MTSDKQVLLSGFLHQLPENVATRLAKAVEVDRLIGGELPHEEILRALRPQLRVPPKAPRMPTPQRFFCNPFEDLLIDSERSIKQKGRIARSSIAPVWNWLAHDLMLQRHQELTEAIRKAIVAGREEEIQYKLADLWSESAAALKAALADEKRRNFAARHLGGVAVAEDAAEIALVIGAAKIVCDLQKRLPRPIVNLSEDDIDYLRDLSDRLFASDPDFAPYVALIVMGRLQRPWEALRLAAAISRKSNDTVLSSTDMGIVGELLFSDLDTYASRIQSARPVDFDWQTLLANLAAFSDLSSGMVKELGIRRDGKWGQRLAKDRGAVAQIMEGLIERAPKEILAALPPYKLGGAPKSQKPIDLSRPSDPERVARAMRYASLMMHSRPFSVAASFSAKLNEIVNETAIEMRTYAEDVVREFRITPREMRGHAEAHLAVTLNLCELVLGQEETDFLRRRARVPAA